MPYREAIISSAAVAAAGLTGAQYGPQHPREAVWYALLRKPKATPPGPVIGAVWGCLEILLCVAGTKLMQAPAGPARNRALGAWWGTLAGLALYPKLFFGEKALGASLAASAGMLGAAGACAVNARKVDNVAASAMAPLVVWLTLATALSADLWEHN